MQVISVYSAFGLFEINIISTDIVCHNMSDSILNVERGFTVSISRARS